MRRQRSKFPNPGGIHGIHLEIQQLSHRIVPSAAMPPLCVFDAAIMCFCVGVPRAAMRYAALLLCVIIVYLRHFF